MKSLIRLPYPGFTEVNLNTNSAKLKESATDLTLPAVNSHALPVVSVLFGLVVVSALLRLTMLGNQSLWLDEGASLAMTDSHTLGGTLSALWSIAGGDKYQITYFFLLSQWRSVIGDSQFALQLLSVIFGALTPVLIYLGLRNTLGERHAFLSAAFIAVSAFCVNYSQEVRPYGFLLCILSLQLWAFSCALNERSGTRLQLTSFALVTLVCCLSSIFLAVFSVCMAIAHLLVYRQLNAWLRWWTPAGIASIPALAYYLATPSIGNITVDAINTADISLWKNVVFALYGHIAGQTYGPSVNALRDSIDVNAILLASSGKLALLLLACCVLAWHGVRVVSVTSLDNRLRKPYLFFLSLFFLAVGAATTLAITTSLNWMPRHSFYLMLPISVLLPIGLLSGHSRSMFALPGRRVTAATVAFTGILMINLHSNYSYFFEEQHGRDDYRSAAAYLEANVSDDDVSLMLWGEPYLLSYYGHSRVESIWRIEDPMQIMSRINQAAAEAASVFVSINREYSWLRHSGELLTLLEQDYVLQPVEKLLNFSIYRLVERDAALAMQKI